MRQKNKAMRTDVNEVDLLALDDEAMEDLAPQVMAKSKSHLVKPGGVPSMMKTTSM